MVSLTDALAIGGTALGGFLANRAAGRAADAQESAANRAAGVSERQFDILREDLAPFREQGVNALNQFAGSALGPLEETPAFQFRRDQGLRRLNQSMSSLGKSLSGQQIRGAAEFVDALAAQEADVQLNRLASLAGIGQTASNTTGVLGANAASNIGNALLNAGTARASGFVGGSNAINDSINNLLLFNALR